MQDHVHSSGCGCKEYQGAQSGDDLYSAVFLEGIRCLNQKHSGSGQSVIRPFQERFTKQGFVTSDCDGEVILVIPFTSTIKLKSICVIAKSESKFPTKMSVYTNQDNVSFSIKENKPLQQFLLTSNLDGSLHNAVKQSKFYNVTTLILHLSNPTQKEIEFSYVQLKGINTGQKRQIVKTAYELIPNAKKTTMQEMQKNISRLN